MEKYYCLLTHNFKTEKCFTAKEPFEKIEEYLKSTALDIGAFLINATA